MPDLKIAQFILGVLWNTTSFTVHLFYERRKPNLLQKNINFIVIIGIVHYLQNIRILIFW